jgi:hypothetical protein
VITVLQELRAVHFDGKRMSATRTRTQPQSHCGKPHGPPETRIGVGGPPR